MAKPNNMKLQPELDDMDVIMSQLDTNVFVIQETAADDMDEIMSQIDIESIYKPERKCDGFHNADEMDEILSQFDMDPLYDPAADIAVPQELLARYEDAMNEIEEDLILQMEGEEDIEVDLKLSPELLQEYEKAMNAILPKKSTDRYLQAYEVFRNWQKSHRTKSLDEKVITAYFSEASSNYKPSTLWSIYSMLKKILIVKHNVDLKSYCRLRVVKNEFRWISKQEIARIFTREFEGFHRGRS